MNVELQDLINFHLTGQRNDADTGIRRTTGVWPALLAPYRNLDSLRYDFPLILLDDESSPAFVDTLTGAVNRLLREIAPRGNSGERLRRHVLRLEGHIRRLVAAGATGTLGELWKLGEKSLLKETARTEREQVRNSINTARFALQTAGRVIDCNDRLPARVLDHAWSRHEARRAKTTHARISTLAIRLRNMLRVDDLKTDKSRTPDQLKASVGKHFKDAFDFELMSDLLGDSTPSNHLPADRRRRIRSTLEVLEAQQFFRTDGEFGQGKRATYDFLFDNLPGALKAYNERLVDIAAIVKAMAIAELECDNAYNPGKHDGFFDRFGPDALSADDIGAFPNYLVTLHEGECSSLDTSRLMEIVSCDLPIKVLLQVSDAFGDQPAAKRDLYQGSFVQQLASTLMAPGGAYILQTSAAHLVRHQEQIRKGLEFEGPAIFSIFVPPTASHATLPPYLIAAAALESRVFPAFSYDPGAGAGLADRFDIDHNPDVEQDWPCRNLCYEDKDLQAISEQVAFTPADFAITCGSFDRHFAVATEAFSSEQLTPVVDYLDLTDQEACNKVPYVAAVDDDNCLHRLVIDEKLVRSVRRCRNRWHALQELGGVHNSYVSAARDIGPDDTATIVDAEPQDEQPPPVTTPVPDASPDTQSEPDADIEANEGGSDEPYIETPRCTTCDECTNRNDRMFAYDDNKQAYIKDAGAGTFRELVEAAELCQVSIIHPGQPRNPDEQGLAELVKRAEPFQ